MRALLGGVFLAGLLIAGFRLWSAQNGRLPTLVLRPGDFPPAPGSLRRGEKPSALAFSPDGQRLAVGTRGQNETSRGRSVFDGSVSVFDTTNGRLVRGWEISGGVDHLAYSPDGELLAVTTLSPARIELWEVAAGRLLRSINTARHSAWGTIEFSADGKTLLVGSDSSLEIWNVATGRRMRARALPDGKSPAVVAASPDGKLVASIVTVHPQGQCLSGKLRLHKTPSLQPIGEWELKGIASSVAWSRDSRFVAAAGLVQGWRPEWGQDTLSAEVAVVDVAARQMLWTGGKYDSRRHPDFREETPSIDSAAFSPDGRFLAVGDDRAAELRHAGTGRVLWTTSVPRHDGSILMTHSGVAFSPDGKLLAVRAARAVNVWDVSRADLAD